MNDTLAFIGRLAFWVIVGVFILEVYHATAGERPGYIWVDIRHELRDVVPSEETLQTIVVERDQLPEWAEEKNGEKRDETHQ